MAGRASSHTDDAWRDYHDLLAQGIQFVRDRSKRLRQGGGGKTSMAIVGLRQ